MPGASCGELKSYLLVCIARLIGGTEKGCSQLKFQAGHLSFSPGRSRGLGLSSTAGAAYRAGVCIVDERTGEVFDYTRKGGIEHSEIIVPDRAHDELQHIADMTRSDDATERAEGHNQFWNANEKAHTRGDAIVSREFEVDFPKELSFDDRKELALEMAREMSDLYGIGIQVSLHEPHTITDKELEKNPYQYWEIDPETGRRHNANWHCHFQFTAKQLNERGFGNKVKEFDPRERKFKSELDNPVPVARQAWESKVQARLDERSIDKIYSLRTNEESRELLIERGHYDLAARIGEPTVHEGPQVRGMERRGEQTNIGDLNRAIKEDNAQYADRADLTTSVLESLTEQKSVFTDRDIYRQICKQATERLGSQLHEAVAQCIARDDVVLLGTDDRGNAVMTTRKMQDMERRMVDQATDRRGEGMHPVDSAKLDKRAKEHRLSDEQRVALHHMSGEDAISLVEGMAGTGKSTMMKAANTAWRESGYEVRGAALAGKAADGLEQGSGIKSQTVHSLLLALDSGRDMLTSRTILCIDEAGMLSSNLTSRLVEHTSKAGAKLVMIGDDRQLQPIQAGGAFKAIKNELGAAKLTTIYRQHEEWARDAVHNFADGESGKAIAAYAERGLVDVGVDADDTKARLIADWNAERTDDGRSSIILAGTRKDVRDLNELARAERVRMGEIDQGDKVKTEQGEREFAKGDRMIFLKNDKSVGVKNGQLGTIEEIENIGGSHRLSIRKDDGKLVTFDTRDYDRIDHGYATTVHKAQGVTAERAYILFGSMFDRQLAYVAMSRFRKLGRLYIDAAKYKTAAMVAKQMDRSNQKGTSLDYKNKTELTKGDVLGKLYAKSGSKEDWSRFQSVAGTDSGLEAPNGHEAKAKPGRDAKSQPAAPKAAQEQKPTPTAREESKPANDVAERPAKADPGQDAKSQPVAAKAAQEQKPTVAAREVFQPVDDVAKQPAKAETPRSSRLKPEPPMPNQELVELGAVDQAVKAYRAERDEEFHQQHGNRPEERDGVMGYASRRKAATWDKAYEGVNRDVEAKRDYLMGDEPDAKAFRHKAYEGAVEKYESEMSAWWSQHPAFNQPAKEQNMAQERSNDKTPEVTPQAANQQPQESQQPQQQQAQAQQQESKQQRERREQREQQPPQQQQELEAEQEESQEQQGSQQQEPQQQESVSQSSSQEQDAKKAKRENEVRAMFAQFHQMQQEQESQEQEQEQDGPEFER